MKIILGICAGIVVLIIIFAALPEGKPATYGDIARDAAASCVRNKGGGHWRGSLGVTLEQFCEGVGNIQAMTAHRKAHPEKY